MTKKYPRYDLAERRDDWLYYIRLSSKLKCNHVITADGLNQRREYALRDARENLDELVKNHNC